MQIYIKSLLRTLPLPVEASQSINNVKQRIQEKLGIPVDQQCLFFSGNQLENERTLVDYHMKDEDIVILIVTAKCPIVYIDGKKKKQQIGVRLFDIRESFPKCFLANIDEDGEENEFRLDEYLLEKAEYVLIVPKVTEQNRFLSHDEELQTKEKLILEQGTRGDLMESIWNFDKIGRKLEEIQKENKETKNKLAVVLQSKESNSPTCPTMSGFGQAQVQKYQIITQDPENDSNYVNPFKDIDYRGSEEAFNNDIYCLLKECTSSLESSGIILINGEEHLSLLDINHETDRKPDFLLCHKAFYVEKSKKLGGTCLFYGTVHKDFQNQVLCAWEGKVTIIDNFTNLGIIFNYVHIMLNLGIENPLGILYNQHSIFFCDGNQLKLFKFNWNSFSINFLKEKFSSLSVNFPRLTSVLIRLAGHFNVEPVLGGYCGKGFSGYCFKVQDRNGMIKVLKIILDHGLTANFENNCVKEYQNALEAKNRFAENIIPIEENCFIENDYCGFLYSRCGSRVSNHYQRVRKLFTLLFQFHQQGFIHGDPRIDNIVEIQENSGVAVKFIDFATFQPISDLSNAMKENLIYNDLDKLWNSLGFVKKLPSAKFHLPKDNLVVKYYCLNFTLEEAFTALLNFLSKFKEMTPIS